MSNDLLVPQDTDLVEIFKDGGVDPLIDKIEAELSTYVFEIDTEAGRAQIASIARKVASSKVALDNAGKALVADKKKEISLVDAERRRVWDRLEQLQHKIRKPLTDFEAELKRKKEELEAAARAIKQAEIQQEIDKKLHAEACEAVNTLAQDIAEQNPPENKTQERRITINPDGSKSQPFQSFIDAVTPSVADKRAALINVFTEYLIQMSIADIEYLLNKVKMKWFGEKG